MTDDAWEMVDTLFNALADPMILIGMGCIVFAAFFFYDRYKKNKD